MKGINKLHYILVWHKVKGKSIAASVSGEVLSTLKNQHSTLPNNHAYFFIKMRCMKNFSTPSFLKTLLKYINLVLHVTDTVLMEFAFE